MTQHRASLLAATAPRPRLLCVLACAAAPALAGDPCAPSWDHTPGAPGATASVHALAYVPDVFGGEGRVVAGGDFSMIGGVAAARLASWNGSTWEPIPGSPNGPVYAIAVFDDGNGPAMYVGGAFSEAGGAAAANVARWDGAQWSALGAGVNNDVYTMHAHDDGAGPALYIGGVFTQTGGVNAFSIVRWNGQSLAPFAVGMNGSVRALASWMHDGSPRLGAFGGFTTAGGVSAARAASWDGAAWSPLGAGLSGVGQCAAPHPDGGVVVGGIFGDAGGAPANRVAWWDGASWSPLGSGVNDRVRALRVADLGDGQGPAIYAGGDFIVSGGEFVPRAARWDGATWAPIASTIDNGAVRALAFAPQTPGSPGAPGAAPALWLGGDFTVLETQVAVRVTRLVGCASDEPPPECPGDADMNGVVDFADLSVVLSNFGASGTPGAPGDLNNDGEVDFADLSLVLSNFGAVCE